jgi:hypothetical protein
MNLEIEAMRWLWQEKHCHYILRERYPRYDNGEPDVLGITKDRFLIEIEIKRSMNDFYADLRKRHRRFRNDYLPLLPKYFYYLVDKELATKLKNKVPEWAGLLYSDGCSIWVTKSAPANKLSTKLTLKECVKATRQIVNHLMSLELVINHQMSNWRQDRYYDYSPVKGDFQI